MTIRRLSPLLYPLFLLALFLLPGNGLAVPLGVDTIGSDYDFGVGVDFRHQHLDLQRKSYRHTVRDKDMVFEISKPPVKDAKRASTEFDMGLVVFSVKLKDYLDVYALLGGVRTREQDFVYRDGVWLHQEEFTGEPGLAGGLGLKGNIADFPISDTSYPSGVQVHFDTSYLHYRSKLDAKVTTGAYKNVPIELYYRPSGSVDNKASYQLEAHDLNFKLLASLPCGPLLPYVGLSATYLSVSISGKVENWVPPEYLFTLRDNYRFTNPHPFTAVTGLQWNILSNLRAYLEAEGLHHWGGSGGVSYLF